MMGGITGAVNHYFVWGIITGKGVGILNVIFVARLICEVRLENPSTESFVVTNVGMGG
jgi:hypothetical protein